MGVLEVHLLETGLFNGVFPWFFMVFHGVQPMFGCFEGPGACVLELPSSHGDPRAADECPGLSSALRDERSLKALF